MKIPRFPNWNNSPPGGWRYYVKETGILMRDTTLGEVINKVNANLESNGFPPMDRQVLKDQIEEEICKETPDYCTGNDVIPGNPVGRRNRSINEVISGTKTIGSWVMHLLKGKGNASVEEAERRAEICSKCPENINPEGCTSCKQAAVKGLLGKVVPFKTSKDNELKSCRVCGCYLKLKVCIDQKILEKNMPAYVIKELPDHCWLKPENKTEANNLVLS